MMVAMYCCPIPLQTEPFFVRVPAMSASHPVVVSHVGVLERPNGVLEPSFWYQADPRSRVWRVAFRSIDASETWDNERELYHGTYILKDRAFHLLQIVP